MIVKLESGGELKNNHHSRIEDIYIVNGQYQPTGEKSFERLILQLVQTIPRYQSLNLDPNRPTGSSTSTLWRIAMPTTTSKKCYNCFPYNTCSTSLKYTSWMRPSSIRHSPGYLLGWPSASSIKRPSMWKIYENSHNNRMWMQRSWRKNYPKMWWAPLWERRNPHENKG